MAKDTMSQLPQHVEDELRGEFNGSYTQWRGENPDGYIIDWLKGLPWSVYWSANDDYDTDSEMWRAWVDFCIWLANENRLVAEAGRKETRADE